MNFVVVVGLAVLLLVITYTPTKYYIEKYGTALMPEFEVRVKYWYLPFSVGLGYFYKFDSLEEAKHHLKMYKEKNKSYMKRN